MRIQAHAHVTADAVDIDTRTITGIACTYGTPGNTSAGPTVIQAGAITVPDRVVMLVGHDDDRPIGRLVESTDNDQALVTKFRVVGTAGGDTALLEAGEGIRDGLSVGLDVTGHDYDGDTLVVTAGVLREVSLVTFPAFTDARVTDVAASESDEASEISDTDPVPDTTEKEGTTVDDSTAPDAVEAPTVTASVPARVQDPFPYTPGDGASYFRDLLNTRSDVQAAQRVQVAQQMMTAAQKTSDVAQVIPPGYRPDLYVSEESAGTPLSNSVRRMAIDDATPFKIPAFGAGANLAGQHTEGVNPTDGTMAFNEITVNPVAVSGKYTASREMLDAANPNLDAIILGAMAEDYAQHIEGIVAANLGLANAGTNATGGKVTAAVLTNLAAFNATRKFPADRLAVGSQYFGALIGELDGSGRPMNPYLSPSNASGTSGAAAGSVNVQGLGAIQAWALDPAAAMIYRASDHILFTSSRLSWRWEEQAGPANIVFAQFGYAAMATLNTDGALQFTDGVSARTTK